MRVLAHADSCQAVPGVFTGRFDGACHLRGITRTTYRKPVACTACATHTTAAVGASRRALLATGLSLSTFVAAGASAAGIESITLPSGPDESKYEAVRRRNRESLAKSTESFENSDILRTLREKTDANKEKNRRALQDRYCYRQAELGVGDCGGLRLIPGATKSGKQKTPEWLRTVLQKLGRAPPEETPAGQANDPAAAVETED